MSTQPNLDPQSIAQALVSAELRDLSDSPRRRPSSTYRLQVHHGFRLDDVADIVGYLADLGISDCYLSPYLDARPGSTHGYDIFDHCSINAEIGDESSHDRLRARLREHGMGRYLDIVPNHMGVGGRNKYWNDVLEIGRHAPSASFFDIDWHPVKEELEGKVLLPILEDQYGRVLESGKLVLEREGGSLFVRYHEARLPLAPRSYAIVLEQRYVELSSLFDPRDENLLEYRSIWASAKNLPASTSTDSSLILQKVRERAVIKRRLKRLCDESPAIRDFLDANIDLFKGEPGRPRTFDLLDRLLEEQVYRLAFWRVASEEINYRRFFDINELAGLRTEDPVVFETIHQLVLRWVDQGDVTGLRIDHPDGLANPLGYFLRLQESIFLRGCRRRFEAEHPGCDWAKVSNRVQELYRESIAADPASPLARNFPIVAEKILSRGEDLPSNWPIDGTVGYEFLNTLNGLFVDHSALEKIEATYQEFTGDSEPPTEVLYNAKRLINRYSLASEINALARQLNRISERDRRSRDFTLNDLRRALSEVIANFPVYRTYIQPGYPMADRDREYIQQAVARARRRSQAIDVSVFDFVQESLLFEPSEDWSPEELALRGAFVTRFQQTTGPIQAKGLEDTAFYRQVKLASLNEVGGDPQRFGNSPAVFHALNSQRLSQWPGSFSTTATHDTKRGEDARIRIDVLSELPDEWRSHLAYWSRWNSRKKTEIQGKPAPDAREEHLFYQTLIGAWPMNDAAENVPHEFVERIQQYMIKAAREAKLNTSWIDPDPTYSEVLSKFVSEVLEGADAGLFLKDFLPFQRKISRIAVIHSLAQTLLKLTSPGVADIYQGCELWDLSLVDPDNRRPVDYATRRRMLDELRGHRGDANSTPSQVARLLDAPEDGKIKLDVIRKVLNHRRSNAEFHQNAAYRPLEVEGDRKANIVAYARHREGRYMLVVAPRLVAGLMGETGETKPLGRETWGESRLVLPTPAANRRWRNLLTEEIVDPREAEGHPVMDLADVFQVLPLAVLVEDGAASG